MFALVAVGAFAPHARLWGLHHLIYYPPFVRIAVLFCVALTIVPSVSHLINRPLVGLATLLGDRSSPRKIATVALVIGCITCFVPMIASIVGG
jgi:hypothetical protein